MILLKRKLEQVVYLAWEESDSWSGPENNGCSLHSSMEKYNAYMNHFARGQQRAYKSFGGVVPECYNRPQGKPVPAYVTRKLYRRICGVGNGLRIYEKEEKRLVRERELLYGKTRFGKVKIVSLYSLLRDTKEYLDRIIKDRKKT